MTVLFESASGMDLALRFKFKMKVQVESESRARVGFVGLAFSYDEVK